MADVVDSYRWLSESPLQVAGCVTLVPAAEPERVARAFGCEPASDRSSTFGESTSRDPRNAGLQAWFSQMDDAVVVVEDNSWEGARSEVLRPASRASSSGVAASVFWNVDGLVTFSAARRGKAVCSVELLDCDLEELPRAVRRLAALGQDESVDLVALGAAMVARFTGVDFGPTHVNRAVQRTLTPVPEDFENYGARGTLLREYVPALHSAILEAEAGQQRRIACWSASAAAAEAGVAEETPVLELIAQFDGAGVPSLRPSFSGLLARWEREQRQWDNENEDYGESGSGQALEGSFLRGRMWAGRSLKAAAHPDAFEAAQQATFNATWTYFCTRDKRPGTWVEDETGRRQVSANAIGLSDRARAFTDIALQALTQPDADWHALRAALPRPFTDHERQEAIRIDRELQASGAFRTFQIEREGLWGGN